MKSTFVKTAFSTLNRCPSLLGQKRRLLQQERSVYYTLQTEMNWNRFSAFEFARTICAEIRLHVCATKHKTRNNVTVSLCRTTQDRNTRFGSASTSSVLITDTFTGRTKRSLYARYQCVRPSSPEARMRITAGGVGRTSKSRLNPSGSIKNIYPVYDAAYEYCLSLL